MASTPLPSTLSIQEETSPPRSSSLSPATTDEEVDDGVIQLAQDAIVNYQSGSSESPTFILNKQSYERLLQHLQIDGLLTYFNEEVRSDWDARTGELTIRVIANAIHGATIQDMIKAIDRELDHVARSRPSLQEDRDKLRSLGNTLVGRKASSHKSPDGQFHYDGIPGAIFVIEVAYTPKRDNIETNVFAYFRYHPSVCTVLTIDIDDLKLHKRMEGQKHGATVSLWTVERDANGKILEVVREEEEEVFRQNDGVAPQGQLRIPFKCFLPPGKRTGKPAQDEMLVFPYQDLADMVKQAEGWQRQEDHYVTEILPNLVYDEGPIKLVNKKRGRTEIVPAEPPAKRSRTDNPGTELVIRTRSKTAAAN